MIAEVRIFFKPSGQGFAWTSGTHNQNTRHANATRGTGQDSTTLEIAPTGKGQDIESAGGENDDTRDVAVTSDKDEEDEENRGSADGPGDHQTFVENAAVARSAIEVLIGASKNDQGGVKKKEAGVGVTCDLVKGVTLGGVVQAETEADDERADDADKYGIDRSVGELDGETANEAVSPDAAIGDNLNRENALRE